MTYFSVDVETTATVVRPRGLLSVGVKVVNHDLSEGPEFYSTIWYPEGLSWDEATLKWWMQQDVSIYEAARPEFPQEHYSPEGVAFNLQMFVLENTAADTLPIFVANPASFDKPWIDHLYDSTHLANPFSHRALCLRSMHFGLVSEIEWGASRETWERFSFPSEMPHHALYDAKAQAKELITLMVARG